MLIKGVEVEVVSNLSDSKVYDALQELVMDLPERCFNGDYRIKGEIEYDGKYIELEVIASKGKNRFIKLNDTYKVNLDKTFLIEKYEG